MRLFGPFLAATCALATSACTDAEPGAPDASTDGPPWVLIDGSAREGGEGAAPNGPTTTFRLAHLSPDLPAIDFCYRNAASDAWVGPVLAHGDAPVDAGAADAGGAGPDATAIDATASAADASPDDASAEDA